MFNVIKKAGVLLAVFVAAIVIYFMWSQNKEEETKIVYTTMEEATLPLVYAEMFGKKTNLMHGYLQPASQVSGRDPLTVLPSDRQLNVLIQPYGQAITAVHYEIRSLDLARLVERTEVAGWTEEDGQVRVVLPIENLLAKESEYLLDMVISTQSQPEIHYYTRITWSDNPNIEQMVSFASDFSSKTFDYNQARELVTYIETNAAEDNSNLGHVTIRSSFSQLTWGDLDVKPEGEVQVTLKELDGIMANVQLDYIVSREAEDKLAEFFRVSENFTMKWNTQRIYLMNYIRNMDEYFDGKSHRFTGKRIMLGVTNDNEASTKKSAGNQYMAFATNGDLWGYDEKKESATRIFSFGSKGDDGIRGNYDQHDIKILSVSDSGDVAFLVYGYMNRGMHEGMVGVSMYQYQENSKSITERFFVPSNQPFSALEADIERLSYLASNDMLYLMMDHAVFGIDLKSYEYLVLADALGENNFAASQDGSRFAWQDNTTIGGTPIIHIMNLENGQKQELNAASGDLLRVLGFVGNDFIYGLAKEGDEWLINGRLEELPMYALEVVNDTLKAETRYEKSGCHIANVRVQDSRIHMDRITKIGAGEYAFMDEDTLVSNNSELESGDEGIGWYASTDKRKVYFVQTELEVKNGQSVKTQAAGDISYESSGTVELKASQMMRDDSFYAYSEGKFKGSRQTFAEAVDLVYDTMGIVTDSAHHIVWNRIDRNAARNIKDAETAARKLTRTIERGLDIKNQEEGILVLDARGCTLNQVLYFVDKGCPVAAYRENGQYYLISGYDQFNITLYSTDTGEYTKMGLGDGTSYFDSMGNDYICAVLTE